MANLHNQDFQLKIKQGLEADINTDATKHLAVEGEPHWTTDTDQLYIFNGTKNLRVPTTKSDGSIEFGDGTNQTVIKDDGEINLEGTARITKNEWISAEALGSAGTKPASVDVNDNGYIIMKFADGVEKEIQANIKIPNDCDTTEDITIGVGWSSPTTDAGDDSKQARWICTYLLTGSGDSTDQAGTEADAVLASASTTANGLIITDLVTVEIASDTICVHLKIERDGNDATDTLGDVVELHGMAMTYTVNKLGEAT